jgi:hypothetical protein
MAGADAADHIEVVAPSPSKLHGLPEVFARREQSGAFSASACNTNPDI